jgi:hypothetical protein
VFDLLEERRTRGWVFVFLGANQDVYQEGGAMGVAAGNRVSWTSNRQGTKDMFQDLAYSTSSHRTKDKQSRHRDADLFYTKDPDRDTPKKS